MKKKQYIETDPFMAEINAWDISEGLMAKERGRARCFKEIPGTLEALEAAFHPAHEAERFQKFGRFERMFPHPDGISGSLDYKARDEWMDNNRGAYFAWRGDLREAEGFSAAIHDRIMFVRWGHKLPALETYTVMQ